MDSRENLFFGLVGLQARLASLVKYWAQTEAHSVVVADTLAKIIDSKPIPSPITDEESNMLPVVVGDALRGVNIAQKYPIFFLRMLENQSLLEDFLDTFDLLQQTQTGALATMPAPFSRDLSFLRRRRSVHLEVQPINASGWRVILQQTIDNLQSLFFPLTLSTDMQIRGGLSQLMDEDNWFTITREEVTVGESRWTLILEGKPADEDEVLLSLDVLVIPMTDTAITSTLVATLQWGTYDNQVQIGPRGRATFPPIPLDIVLDETTERVKAELQLTVEVVNP